MDAAVNDYSTLPLTVLEVVLQQIFQLKLKADATIITVFTEKLLNLQFSSVAEAQLARLTQLVLHDTSWKRRDFHQDRRIFLKKLLHRITKKQNNNNKRVKYINVSGE